MIQSRSLLRRASATHEAPLDEPEEQSDDGKFWPSDRACYSEKSRQSIAMQTILVLIVLLLVLVLLCGSLIARRRFRRLWKEMFGLRHELLGLSKQLTQVRKNLVLVGQDDSQFRLPPRLPSEGGEDIVLFNFFGRKRNGFFLEVGAYNGVDLSNTYFFEAIGWDGILIEPDPELYRQCVVSRPNSKVMNVAASDKPGTLQFTCAEGKEWLSFSGENKSGEQRILAEGGSLKRLQVPCLTLNEILKDCQSQIDFVSIDVEGYEYHVLSGFDLDRFRPRVIVMEQKANDKDSPAVRLLVNHGYVQKLHIGSNSFYIHASDPGMLSL